VDVGTIEDFEKSSILKSLQFEIPSEARVIKRPFVIDEVGIVGRSGQTARRSAITLKIFKGRRNDSDLTVEENEEFEKYFHVIVL